MLLAQACLHAVAIVQIEPVRSAAGALQCLGGWPSLAPRQTFSNDEADGCALECSTLGASGCLWFALTRVATGGYFCLIYSSTRTVETEDCQHNSTALLFDDEFEVWERTEYASSEGDGQSAVACHCVCVSIAATGDAGCDEENGALSGCYAHAGAFNGHPHYEEMADGLFPGKSGGGEPTWLYYYSGSGGAGWLLDSDPAPGHFNARWASAASTALPLGESMWEVQVWHRRVQTSSLRTRVRLLLTSPRLTVDSAPGIGGGDSSTSLPAARTPATRRTSR